MPETFPFLPFQEHRLVPSAAAPHLFPQAGTSHRKYHNSNYRQVLLLSPHPSPWPSRALRSLEFLEVIFSAVPLNTVPRQQRLGPSGPHTALIREQNLRMI